MPSIRIFPSVGSSKRLMERRKVLLPQPDAEALAKSFYLDYLVFVHII